MSNKDRSGDEPKTSQELRPGGGEGQICRVVFTRRHTGGKTSAVIAFSHRITADIHARTMLGNKGLLLHDGASDEREKSIRPGSAAEGEAVGDAARTLQDATSGSISRTALKDAVQEGSVQKVKAQARSREEKCVLPKEANSSGPGAVTPNGGRDTRGNDVPVSVREDTAHTDKADSIKDAPRSQEGDRSGVQIPAGESARIAGPESAPDMARKPSAEISRIPSAPGVVCNDQQPAAAEGVPAAAAVHESAGTGAAFPLEPPAAVPKDADAPAGVAQNWTAQHGQGSDEPMGIVIPKEQLNEERENPVVISGQTQRKEAGPQAPDAASAPVRLPAPPPPISGASVSGLRTVQPKTYRTSNCDRHVPSAPPASPPTAHPAASGYLPQPGLLYTGWDPAQKEAFAKLPPETSRHNQASNSAETQAPSPDAAACDGIQAKPVPVSSGGTAGFREGPFLKPGQTKNSQVHAAIDTLPGAADGKSTPLGRRIELAKPPVPTREQPVRPPAPLSDAAVTAHTASRWKYKGVPPSNVVPDSYDEYLVRHEEYPSSIVDGARVRGKKHKHEGSNADDWFEIGNVGEITLLAVSDGAGSRRLSRIGARTACEASIAYLKQELAKMTKDPKQKDALLAALGIDYQKQDPSFNAALGILVQAVNNAVLQAAEAVEAAQAVRENAPEYANSEGDRPVIGDFAATLLLVVVVPTGGRRKVIVSCQVGDGMVAALDLHGSIDQQTTARIIGKADSGAFSGETEFITSRSALAEGGLKSRTAVCQGDMDLVLAMTDGVADDYFPAKKELPRLYYDLLANGILTEDPPGAGPDWAEDLPMPDPVAYPWVNNQDIEVALQYANRIMEESGKTAEDLWDVRSHVFTRARRALEKVDKLPDSTAERLSRWLDNYVERGSFDDRTLVVAQLNEENA